MEDGNHHRTDFEYDWLNRQRVVIYPQVTGDSYRKRTVTEYDGFGRRVLELDEQGIATAFGYDVWGRLTSVTNAYQPLYNLGETPAVTRYEYDEVGNLRKELRLTYDPQDNGYLVKPPDTALNENVARATVYEYDVLGRRTHRFLPGAANLNDVASNSSMERINYAKVGTGPWILRKDVRDFRDKSISYYYDVMGRLTTKSLPQVTAGADVGRTVTYTYTGALLTQVTESGVGVSRTEYSAYDNSRRLRKKDSPEGVLTYSYNARGQLATLKGFARTAVIVNGEVGAAAPDVDLEYGYDPLGRLQTVKNYKKGATQNVSTNWYDMAGNLVETSYPNSTRHHWDYTEQNRMKSTVVEKVAGSTATLLRRYDYTLNAASLRTAVSEKETPTTYYRNVQYKYDFADPKPVVGVTVAGGTTTEYRADLPRLNRLTEESAQLPATGLYKSADYSYDLVGNRLTRTDNGLGVGNQTLEYDVKDRVAGTSPPLGFDANGNTTSSANGTVLDYYDAENRLVKRVAGTTTITMGYDPSGNRAWKHVQTGSTHKNIYFLVDDRNPTGYAQVLAEYTDQNTTADNASNGTFSAGYEYGLDLISQRHPTSGVLYFSYDGQGSIRALFTTLGDLSTTYRWDYDAWGKYTLNLSGSIDPHYRYTGEQWDPDLGLFYLRARYYSPEYGRFWSRDIFEGVTEDPASLQKYLYCGADPINNYDPSGYGSERQGMGYLAEYAISLDYMTDHPDSADYTVFGKWVRLGNKTSGSYRLKPDIFDMKRYKFAEIKPLSISGIADGVAQLTAYTLTLGLFGYSPEKGWPPHPRETFAGQVPIVYFNVGGIIFYTDIYETVKDVAAIASIASARQFVLANPRVAQGAFTGVRGALALARPVGMALRAAVTVRVSGQVLVSSISRGAL